MIHIEYMTHLPVALPWDVDTLALVASYGSVMDRHCFLLAKMLTQGVPCVTFMFATSIFMKAVTAAFSAKTSNPIYSHLGLSTRIFTAPLLLKRSCLRLAHNDGKGQCFWRSVAYRQHAWKTIKHRSLATLLPCSRHIESKHRAQWASQVEIAAFAQAYSTPITVLSAQQGKAFTFVPPNANKPMIYVLHQNDHFQPVIHIPPGAYMVGGSAEAHFTEIPTFPAMGEVILPNIGSAVAFWLGKMPLGLKKLDFDGPQAVNLDKVDVPPNAHAAATYYASQCQHLADKLQPPTIPTLGRAGSLAAGGPKFLGPFIPDPRPKAKPPPAHVYDGAGWSLSGWAADVYCCKGIGCIHGSPGPEYPCCAAEFDQPSECQTSSDEESSLPYYSPKSPSATNLHPSGGNPVPKLDIFKGVPGYNILSNLRKRVQAFAKLTNAVRNVTYSLQHYSSFHDCLEEESLLWVANARYWNHKCSHLQVDFDTLQNNVAQAASEAFVPFDEKPFWDVSSGTCPIDGNNLLPGLTHHEQFQVLANLIQMRAHYATKSSSTTHDEHELHLVAGHASIFQRFAWHYFANADINEAFLDALLKETMTTTSRGYGVLILCVCP